MSTSNSSRTTQPRVWFITGTSQGFGRELVQAALQRGDSVVATSRDPKKVTASFPEAGDRLLAVAMDLKDSRSVAAAVDAAVARFGRLDVLVNNAGHGVVGAVEEASDDEIRSVYEINVLGLLRVTRAVLPHFRRQRSGYVINLSSIGGLVGIPGYGIYNHTKFAVEGLSEALASEVKPLGIHVTVVEPGPFRTDFLGGSLASIAQTIDDYQQTSGQTRAAAGRRHGGQPGDPVKAAQAIVGLVDADKPPLHLLLGRMAFERANQKLDELRAEFTAWRDVTLNADYQV